MICLAALAHTAVEGQQPRILEMDDEAKAYALLGDSLPDCLPCEPFMVELHEVYHLNVQHLYSISPGYSVPYVVILYGKVKALLLKGKHVVKGTL
jgi:hypothetical protein